ncbi:MAG: hypothetical protein DDT18_01160 [Actinobacteria bacterium]|nr:hypothetical protein [Actinomycetota bacterium]
MEFKTLIEKYINRHENKREMGRYYASDIYSILKARLTPENFFEPKIKTFEDAKLMITGLAMEEKLKDIFEKTNIEFEYQPKKEYKVNDEVLLVVKPDFVFKNFILETKFSFFEVKGNEVPLRYCYQLECEARAFRLPVYLGVFSVPFDLKIIPYMPYNARWGKIKRTLVEFHKKLKEIKLENPKPNLVEERLVIPQKKELSHVIVVRNYFVEECKKKKGISPEINYAKEGKLLKDRLKKYTVEQLKDLIDKFLNSNVGEKFGWSLSICLSTITINQWLAGKLEKARKPYFQGNPMRKKYEKWEVFVNGEWLEFAGKEAEIIYK